MTGDIRHVVIEAVRLHGSSAFGLFTIAAFSAAMRAEFRLYESPQAAWCRTVLEQLPYVNQTSSGYLWVYKPEATPE
jgi:hypothetical protein